LEPQRYLCPLLNIDIGDLSSVDYTEHILRCSHCGAALFHLRHEFVGSAYHRTSRYWDYLTEHNPKGFPVPGKRRGGPDLLQYLDEVMAVDFSIEIGRGRFTRKIRHYEEFEQATTFRTIPYVMSPQAMIDSKTESLMTSWRVPRKYLREIFENTQFALLKGEYLGVKVLHGRQSAQELEQEYHDEIEARRPQRGNEVGGSGGDGQSQAVPEQRGFGISREVDESNSFRHDKAGDAPRVSPAHNARGGVQGPELGEKTHTETKPMYNNQFRRSDEND
jgi:hypothetical protein